MKIKLFLYLSLLLMTINTQAIEEELIIEDDESEYMLCIREEPEYENVTTLRWTNSNLTAVRKTDFQYMTQLKTIDLRYNKIATVDLDAFKHLKNLEVLDLSGNPLKKAVKEALQRSFGRKLKLTSPKLDIKFADSDADSLNGDLE